MTDDDFIERGAADGVSLDQPSQPIGVARRDDIADGDAEARVTSMAGHAVAERLRLARGSISFRAVQMTVDGFFWVPRAIVRGQRWWSTKTTAQRAIVKRNFAYWAVGLAIILAMGVNAWLGRRAEAREALFAARGSCAVCMDTAATDISRACRPVTEYDLGPHRQQLRDLIAVLDGRLAAEHDSCLAAAIAGSPACIGVLRYRPPSWTRSEVLIYMYNPQEVPLGEAGSTEGPRRADDGAVAPVTLAERQQRIDPDPVPAHTAQKRPAALRIRRETVAAPPPPPPPPPIPSPAPIAAVPAAPAVEYLTVDEPSDFFADVVLPRRRPTPVRIRYSAPDEQSGAFVTRYITLANHEAACMLYVLEVLNGTHHALYSRGA